MMQHTLARGLYTTYGREKPEESINQSIKSGPTIIVDQAIVAFLVRSILIVSLSIIRNLRQLLVLTGRQCPSPRCAQVPLHLRF